MTREPKDYSLSIRFSQEDGAKLQRLAETEDVSVAVIVRRAVREYLERASPKKKPKK